jgi:hypothetical protein
MNWQFWPWKLTLIALLVAWGAGSVRAEESESDARRSATEEELRGWLQNMVWYHRYSHDEIAAATGLSMAEIDAALARWEIRPDGRPPRGPGEPLRVLPYPGGRHPRIGFLEGAIRPQRETKLSVFTPWDAESYVVLDVPEAVWSNLGLTYLAHTHIPTVWDQRELTLAKQEWQVGSDGSFASERTLPDGIVFGTKVRSCVDHLEMHMWLTNGTAETLSDLRVQNCVMLKGAKGFEQQTNDNKYFSGSYVAAHNPDKDRWIIVAWEPLHRGWANPPCPCLHSDPKFPDCAPGETQHLRGWFSFFEGTDIDAELARIDATGWRTAEAPRGP